jgi:hypothetical protein
MQVWPFATRSRNSILFLVANGSSQLHKLYQSQCTVKNSWWWAERLPETCRVVILIKLEFSTSVGFIQKESVTMHGHTIVKRLLVSSSLSIRVEQLGPNCTDFHEIWKFLANIRVFTKIWQERQVLYIHNFVFLWQNPSEFFSVLEMSQRKLRRKSKHTF